MGPAKDKHGVRESFAKVNFLFAKNGRSGIKEFWSTTICHVYNVYLWYQIYLCHHWFHVIWVTPIIEYHWSWWKMISICIICHILNMWLHVNTMFHVGIRCEGQNRGVFSTCFSCSSLADDMQMQQMHVVELPLRIVGSLGGFQVKSSQTSPAGKLCGKSMHQQLKPQMTAEKLRTDAHL